MSQFRYVHVPDEQDGQVHIFKLDAAAARAIYTEATEWCRGRWRKPNTQGAWYCAESVRMIWLRGETDALEFRLRWC